MSKFNRLFSVCPIVDMHMHTLWTNVRTYIHKGQTNNIDNENKQARNSTALYSQLIGNKEIIEIIPPFVYYQFPADHLMLAHIDMLHLGWELDNNMFIWITDTFYMSMELFSIILPLKTAAVEWSCGWSVVLWANL